MVKIALISDSHSYIDEATIKYLEDVDEIWHAGDIGDLGVIDALPSGKSLRVIVGNIDDEKTQELYPETLIYDLAGMKILMTHIGGKPPRYAKGIKTLLKKEKPQLFVCGHSHICKVEYDKELNCLYMNPGAIGQHGFHVMRTLLLFEINSGKIQNLRVVELGKRGRLK
ncbi:MAG: metallophosphoesterase [Mongoliibacter sp.]|uniref:metallophosphoesterase family protein n=1 Tax=Mongoliibacter sp. TaxID=2022438 RepID=UPI0012F1E97E|nr:metallophosphoesterase family protein [Mongoliibacter sp.]TVP42836.1 MAG: metallophosphoesterase [Mongoliibacter sp.]